MGKQAGSARPKEVRAEGRAEGRELELRPWPAPSPPAGGSSRELGRFQRKLLSPPTPAT